MTTEQRDSNPRMVVEASRALERRASELGADRLRDASLNLANAYGAARRYCAAIEQLCEERSLNEDQVARTLQTAKTWLYDELLGTADDLRNVLDSAIDELYAKSDGQ